MVGTEVGERSSVGNAAKKTPTSGKSKIAKRSGPLLTPKVRVEN